MSQRVNKGEIWNDNMKISGYSTILVINGMQIKI